MEVFKDENVFLLGLCLFLFLCPVMSHSCIWDIKKKPSLSRRVIQKEMAFMLGRHGMFLELNEDVEDYEDLTEIMSNVQLNSNFLALAREVSGAEVFCNMGLITGNLSGENHFYHWKSRCFFH